VTETAQSDGGTDGASHADAASGSDAASGDAIAKLDGPSSEASTCGRVPTDHRASAEPCPTARGQGITMCCPDAGYPGQWQCSNDSDCTMGTQGRCLNNAGPAGTHCSYDDCFSDSDCSDGGGPCVCRTSASDPSPNLCSTGSNCRVDADCGPCGFCSPSPGGSVSLLPYVPYFCHTPADACIDDGDCPDPAQGCCLYDSKSTRWSCAACPVPPV